MHDDDWLPVLAILDLGTGAPGLGGTLTVRPAEVEDGVSDGVDLVWTSPLCDAPVVLRLNALHAETLYAQLAAGVGADL